MAQVVTQRGAFIGGEWVSGDGEEIEVRSPATGESLGAVRAATPDQVDAGRRRGRRGLRDVAPDERARASRDLPAGLRHLHGPGGGDRAHDHPRDRQDDPRVARGDGRVHGRPLPARGRGRHAPRGPGAAVDAGQDAQADPRRAGAGRRRRRDLALELPGRHRGHPDRLRPRVRLHDRVEAVGAGAAVRRAVRRRAARRRLPAGDGQPRARPRRRRRRAHRSPRRRLGGLHRARSRPARRSRARPGSRTASSSWAATARRSCSPTPTSRPRRTPR